MKFRILGFLIAIMVAGAIIGGVFVLSLLPGLPDSDTIRDISLKVPLRVYSSEGLLIAEFGDERRKPVSIENTPQRMRQAVLASEDDGFYQHPGIDIRGIIRAALSNFQAGGSSQGASTITMQVARNYFLTPEKTYVRKIREILLAVRIERNLTKNEILELYINKIFLGHRAYGFGAAAEVYYGKELEDLTLAEQAMLAGLPKAPSRDNPLSNPVRAMERRNYVLGRMRELDWIDSAEFDLATSSPITATPHRTPVDADAPYVAEMVRAELVARYGESVYWEGLNVYTTIVAQSQEAAQAALRAGLMNYDRKHGFRGPVAVVEPALLGESDALPGESDALPGESDALPGESDALPGESDTLPGESDTLPGEPDALTGEPDALPGDLDALLDVLGEVPSSNELIPALVVENGEQDAVVMLRDGSLEPIAWEGMSWARKHLDSDRLGEPPELANEILNPGDIVYVTRNDEPGTGVQLSQFPAVSGAIVSVRPRDGAILALTGGFDFYISKYNRATQAQRQPGSNIKPFIYSAALENGFTTASQVSGAPIVIEDEYQGTVWRPENYSGKFFGPTRLRKALSLSLNLVSIRLLRSMGIPETMDYLEQFGLDSSRLPRGLSLALGTGTITPLEMLSAYALLANGGYRVEPYLIDWVEDRNQSIIYQHQPAQACSSCTRSLNTRPVPVISQEMETKADLPDLTAEHVDVPEPLPGELTDQLDRDTPDDPKDGLDVAGEAVGEEGAVAVVDPILEPIELQRVAVRDLAPRRMGMENNFLLTSMMGDVIRVGTARRALSLNRRDLAGKTGTTNDYRDAWFSGFNRDIATSVWVGFDQPQTLGRNQTGSSAALPIWVNYMETALKGFPETTSSPPDNIVTRRIHSETGKSASKDDPDSLVEYFVMGTEPAEILPTLTAPYAIDSPGVGLPEPVADLEEELF